MKHKEKTKNTELMSRIGMGVVIVGLLYFTFNSDKFNYKYGIQEIKNTTKVITDSQSVVDNFKAQLEGKKSELKTVTEKYNAEKIKTDKTTRRITVQDLKLDLASLIIRLEDNARLNNLTFLIDYNGTEQTDNSKENIQTTEVDENGNPIEKVKDRGNKVNEEIKEAKGAENQEVKGDENKEENQEEKQEEINLFDEKGNALDNIKEQAELDEIDGLQTVKVPITVTGSYYQIRNFMKFIETIDYITPSTVMLQSQGGTTKAVIILQVFTDGGVN